MSFQETSLLVCLIYDKSWEQSSQFSLFETALSSSQFQNSFTRPLLLFHKIGLKIV